MSDQEIAESVKIQKTEETKEEVERPPTEESQKRKLKVVMQEEKITQKQKFVILNSSFFTLLKDCSVLIS